MPELAAIIARLEPELGPLEGRPRPLEGGITNRNYRLRMGGEDLVLRLCDRGAEVLGIDRTHGGDRLAPRRRRGHRPAGRGLPERRAGARDALAAGRRRPVEHMRTPGVMAQVAAMLRRLHATPALPSAFAIFRLVEQQRPLADALPDSYERPAGAWLRRIEAACPPAPSTSRSPATTTC